MADEPSELPPNPFLFGRVAQSDFYCPRPDLEKTILSRISSGQGICLQGARRFGKTSLIVHLAAKHFRGRFFRADFMGVKTAAEAVEEILNSWVAFEKAHRKEKRALAFLTSLNLELSILGSRIKIQPSPHLESVSLDPFFAQVESFLPKGKRFLIFFDEFQSLQSLENDDRHSFLQRLRKSIQHLQGISFVYAGSVRSAMHEIFQHPESPFYYAAETFEVGPIEPPERFRKFLSAKFSQGNRTLMPDFWPAIEAIVAHNPSDTQRFCAALWDTSPPGVELNESAIEEALERIFAHENETNLALLTHATAIQKKTLIGIALHGGKSPTSQAFLQKINHRNGSSVLKALGHFVDRGVLAKGEKGYTFNNPFLREWLNRR
ncbi:MAG: hypothetical protein AAF191_11030 [Verrucomicrobiota bacterium]